MTKQEIIEKINLEDTRKIAESLGIPDSLVEKIIYEGNFEAMCTAEQVIYNREVAELKCQARTGDFKLVGEVMGTSGDHASKLISRTTAKKHPLAVRILRDLIKSRNIIKEKSKINSIAF